MALSQPDRERLARLLAMFSSDFDGEVVNAARAAERLIKKAGETWESVIVPPAAHVLITRQYDDSGYRPKPRYRDEEPPHKAEVAECIEKADILSNWEREFLTSISQRFTLSDKQRATLDRIKAKIKQSESMPW